MPDLGVYGQPGIQDAKTASWRRVLRSGVFGYLGQGKKLGGTIARDPGNVGWETHLRAGVIIGKSTADSLLYGSSIVGLTSAALTGTGTTLSATAVTTGAGGVVGEIQRRFGSAGTFKLTGPPTAGGTVRSLTLSHSAVSLTLGTVTITAAGVNEVDTIAITGTINAGNIWFVDQTTGAQSRQVAFNAAIGAVQSALDDVFGDGNTVASAGMGASFTVTFQGTLAGTAMVLSSGMPRLGIINGLTNTNAITVTRTTAGVDGRFVAGSLIQPADGSETMLTFMPDGYPTQVSDTDGNVVDTDLPKMPIEGEVEGAQLINWPTDTALQNYIMDQLSTSRHGKFNFSGEY